MMVYVLNYCFSFISSVFSEDKTFKILRKELDCGVLSQIFCCVCNDMLIALFHHFAKELMVTSEFL